MEWINLHTGETVRDIVMAKSGLQEEDLINPKSVSAFSIEGIRDAGNMIFRALKSRTPITIFGDYDGDGITATTILMELIRFFGVEANYRLPRRMSEGYGISMKALDEITSGLLITVDNGITANEVIASAKQKGLQVIVIDHHLPNEELPCADVIVNPHVHPERNGFTDYCGAGLALKLAQACLSPYMKTEYKPLAEALLTKLTALAAIGTIADVMPLVGDNRKIVKHGLALLTEHKNELSIGVQALLDVTNLYVVTEGDIGFKIGPMLNAPGRLDDNGAQYVVETLLCTDYTVARQRMEQVNEWNETRKELVHAAMENAERIISEECLFCSVPLIIADESIHEGIVGIVTGKLAEKYRVPTFVFSASEANPDVLKGSGRSYGGINLKETLIDPIKDLLVSYGGHAGAAGITVKKVDFPDMVAKMSSIMAGHEVPEQDAIQYDMETTGNLPDIYQELAKYAPYGEGNPAPVFCLRNVVLSPRMGSHYKFMGKNFEHIKLTGNGFSAVAFGKADDYKKIGCPLMLDMVGKISMNYYRAKGEIQVEVEDFAPSTDAKKKKTSSLLDALMENGTI